MLRRHWLIVALAAAVLAAAWPFYVRITYHVRNQPDCPQCGRGPHVVPIVYGLPTSEGFEADRAGGIRLGGCVIERDSPRWYCRQCEQRWGQIRDRKWPWKKWYDD